MGSGKSTLGPLLARALKLRYVDTDQVVEQETGKTIAETFREEGEAAFRAREKAIVLRLAAGHGQVVSLGGGALLDPETRATLLKSGLLIYLKTSPAVLAQRLRGTDRPLLRVDGSEDLTARIHSLLSEREVIYRTAPVTIDTDQHTPPEIVKRLTKEIAAWKG